MRAFALAVALILSTAVLTADDHSVIFDEDVDFSIFKTFTLREGVMRSDRPELRFPAVMQNLGGAIRVALTTKGLKEVPDRADLVVEYSVTGQDYDIGPFGRANVVRAGSRGRRGAGPSGGQVDFTDATLVVDLKRRDSDQLLWRGVYHDTEEEAAKLADALTKNAATLLSQYPPRRRR